MSYSVVKFRAAGLMLFAAILGQPSKNAWAWERFDQPAWRPTPEQNVGAPLTDLELTLRLRGALEQDDKLGDNKIGASVKDRVAMLWGSVSSPELSSHVVEIAQKTPGITSVINHLRIIPTLQPTIQRSTEIHSPLAEPIIPGPPRTQGAIVHRTNEQALISEQESRWKTLAPLALRKANDVEIAYLDAFGVRHAPAPGESVWQPRNHEVSANPLGRRLVANSAPEWPVGQLVAPNSIPTAHEELHSLIEAVRLSDNRFIRLRVEVNGEAVHLSGNAYAWMDVLELSRSVSRLRGVKRIVLEGILIDSAPQFRQ